VPISNVNFSSIGSLLLKVIEPIANTNESIVDKNCNGGVHLSFEMYIIDIFLPTMGLL